MSALSTSAQRLVRGSQIPSQRTGRPANIFQSISGCKVQGPIRSAEARLRKRRGSNEIEGMEQRNDGFLWVSQMRAAISIGFCTSMLTCSSLLQLEPIVVAVPSGVACRRAKRPGPDASEVKQAHAPGLTRAPFANESRIVLTLA